MLFGAMRLIHGVILLHMILSAGVRQRRRTGGPASADVMSRLLP